LNQPVSFKAALALARQKAAEERSLEPGNRSFLRVKGRGPAPCSVLFLHGFSASPFEGLELGAYLAKKGFPVYAPLLAGHGQGRAEFDRVAWRAWLATAEDGLDIARGLGHKTVILGHSAGGVLACLLADKRPGEVAALVLGSPAFSMVNPLAKWMVFGAARALKPSLAFKSDDEAITRHWTMTYGTQALAELVRAGKLGEKALFKLRLPIAIFQGSEDSIISTRDNLRRFPKIPSRRKQFVVYPTEEHNAVYKSNPFQKQVFAWITDFLNETVHD
jgi:carboxylesterase